MIGAYTEDYECPDCLSTQRAKVLKLDGWTVKLLRCVTCKTEWDPTIPWSMQRAVDFGDEDDLHHTPDAVHGE